MSVDITELLREYANILETLKERGVVKTRNSPVGDYTEWLVAKAFRVERETPSKPGYDLKVDGEKYQIKGRWLRQDRSNRQLSIIRNLHKNQFHFLIRVLFDDKFNVKEAYKIPHSIIDKYAAHSSYQNGHILHLTAITKDATVDEITECLQATQ